MAEILSQITSVGGISASWILVGITSVAGFLFWTQLKDIKRSLEKSMEKLGEHDTDIEVLKMQQKSGIDRLVRLDEYGREQYEKIMEKLEAITPK